MMKTMEFLFPTPGTSAVTYYIPIKDPSRLIGLLVSAGADQSSGTVTIEDGATNTIMTTDLSGIDAAGDVVRGTFAGTEAQQKVIFDHTNPLVLKIDLQADTNVGIQLVLDPFQIGKHKGLATS